jgi:hypothetical protein
MTSASHMLNAMSSYDEQHGPEVEAQPLLHMRGKFAVSRLAAVEVFARTRGTSHLFASHAVVKSDLRSRSPQPAFSQRRRVSRLRQRDGPPATANHLRPSLAIAATRFSLISTSRQRRI